MAGLFEPDGPLTCLKVRSPSSASPKRLLTYRRSPSRAPDLSTACPTRTSPTTVILIRISFRRVVSPPASTHWNLREARRSPPRNRSSHRPVCVSGRARLSRKQRGAPPIAAPSLIALARHFHPTASGGCFFRKKCVLSRNQ